MTEAEECVDRIREEEEKGDMRKILVCLCACALILAFAGAASATIYKDYQAINETINPWDTLRIHFDITPTNGGTFVPGQDTITKAEISLKFASSANAVVIVINGDGDGNFLFDQTVVIIGADGTSTEVHILASLNQFGTLDVLVWNASLMQYVRLQSAQLTAYSATPEPTTMLLFGSGLLTLGILGRRKRKRNKTTT
jgi:hypothetical protein